CSPKLNHARVSLFFAHHGFAEKLKITDQNYNKYVKDNIEGTGKLNRLCQAANTDLRLYELDTTTPTMDCLGGDSSSQHSMDTDDMVKAIAYGMMSVEPGIDMISATAFGHGSEASARALYYVHSNISCDDLTVARLLKPNGGRKGFDALQQIGGFEIAALCGLVIAAKLANVPVLLEGETGAAVLSILKYENAGITDHCALTGWDEIKLGDVPFFAMFHAVPKEPGLAASSIIPLLKNQIILQGAN
ncbi:MAG: hypothetical protein DI586_11435, partial [Micavibrio aeruginosavorus]